MASKEETGADSQLAKALDRFAEIQLQIAQAAEKTSLNGEQLEAILSKVGLTSAAAMQKALRPENERPPLYSVFEPDGENIKPKAKLKRHTFFCDSREHTSDDGTAEMLTPFEVQTYNDLGDGCAKAGGRLEARNGQYVAELRGYNQKELHVYVKGIDKMDTKTNLPPTLVMLCHEILTGENMQDLNSLLIEVERLRAQVTSLGGTPSPRESGSAGTTRPPTITAKGGPLVADLQAALDATPTAALAGGR